MHPCGLARFQSAHLSKFLTNFWTLLCLATCVIHIVWPFNFSLWCPGSEPDTTMSLTSVGCKRTWDDASGQHAGSDTVGAHLLSCLRTSKHAFSSNMMMPWERQFIGPVDVVKNVFKLPVPVRELSENTFSKAPEVEDLELRVGSSFRKAGLKLVKACDEKLWSDRLSAERKAAIRKWTSLVAADPAAWDIAVRFFGQGSMTYATGGLSDSIKDALASKASSTLHARVNPLYRFATFCADHGIKPWPVHESTVYDFLKSNDSFAATFPKSFLISLTFAKHTLGLRGEVEWAVTGRSKGVSHTFFLKKRKLVQRPPLSVAQVARLEKVVMDENRGVADRIAAGFFCFTLYSRARYSDALSVVKINEDIVLRDGMVQGFLEAEASRSKTSTTLDKKTQFLPLTALVKSVGSTDWVRVWMQLRRSEHLEAAEGKPLLPGPQEGGTWSSIPLSASSAALWLRSLLDGTEGPPIAEVGTHSLKATCLSWCSKYGMELSMRRALGYHHTAADRSVNTYARDAMAAPLRCLQEVITSIVEGKFFPDKTRSGMFADDSELQAAQERYSGEPVESSSESSGDEEDHEFGRDEEAIDRMAGEWQGNKTTPWMTLAAIYYRHNTSRCIHVLQDEGGAEFCCGRRISMAYVRLERRPQFLHPVCTTCERIIERHAS